MTKPQDSIALMSRSVEGTDTTPMDGLSFIYLPTNGEAPAENGKPYELTLVFNGSLTRDTDFGRLATKLLQAAPLNPPKPVLPKTTPVTPAESATTSPSPSPADKSVSWITIAAIGMGALGALMLIVAGLAAAAFLGAPLIAAFVAGTAIAPFILHISVGALVLTALSFTALGCLLCPKKNLP